LVFLSLAIALPKVPVRAQAPAVERWSNSDSAMAASISGRIEAGKALARELATLSPSERAGAAGDRTTERSYKLGWHEVAVNLRAIGESRDAKWVPLLSEYWREFRGDGAPSPAFNFNTMGDLRMETVRAYRKIALPDVHGIQALKVCRDFIAKNGPDLASSIEAEAHGQLFLETLKELDWSPEVVVWFDDSSPAVRISIMNSVWTGSPDLVRERYLMLLLDPDPRIRSEIRKRIMMPPNDWKMPTSVDAPWVRTIHRFLERDGLSEGVVRTLVESLRVRGFSAEQIAGNRWILHRIPDQDQSKFAWDKLSAKKRDKVLAALLDPRLFPIIRIQLLEDADEPHNGRAWIPALKRFLGRADLTPKAREVASEALKMRTTEVAR